MHRGSTSGVLQDNNTACILLQSFNYDAANYALQRAMQTLKKRMIEQDGLPEDPSYNCSTSSQSHDATMNDIHSDTDTAAAAPTYSCHPLLDYNDRTQQQDDSKPSSMQSVPVMAPLCPRSGSQAMSIYNRAFILSKDDFYFEDQQWAISIIFYNMALVHHSQGVHQQDVSSASLRLAIRFYELAATMLDQIAPFCDDMNMPLLQCAIVNNTGHCHACLFNLESARQSFRLLKRVFANLLCRNPGGITDEDYALFFLNTLVQVDGLCLAPAA
jgi:hypothetical protein